MVIPEPRLRTDMVKIIYAICLSELGIEKTAAIFSSPALRFPGREVAFPETVKIIWNGSSKFIPVSYAFRISNIVEDELRKICSDPSTLVRNQFRKYTGGTALLPAHVLDMIDPILRKLFSLDASEVAFDYLEKINDFVAPGTG